MDTLEQRPRFGCYLVIAVIIIALIGIALYRFSPNWTGFSTKTLWDWMQLLIIPFILALGGYLYNNARDKTERGIASDKQREDALQAYIDNMSELLLEKHLRVSQPEDEVRKIARIRTLTVLHRLYKNGSRQGTVIQFLREAGLIDKDKPIIVLKEASLVEAFLMFADLSGTDLSDTLQPHFLNLTRKSLEQGEKFRAPSSGVSPRRA